MKEFVAINKTKFRIIAIVVLIVSALIGSCFYFIPMADVSSTGEMMFIHLLMILILAPLLFAIIFIAGYAGYRKEQTLLDQPLLATFLNRFHFQQKVLTGNSSVFARRIYVAVMESYDVVIHLNGRRQREVVITVPVDHNTDDIKVYEQQRIILEKENIDLMPGMAVSDNVALEDLDIRCRQLIALLKKYDLGPTPETFY